MMWYLKLFILTLVLSSAAIADEACDKALLGTDHAMAITELVKGYQALERANIEDQSMAARRATLRELNKRKADLETIYGEAEFKKLFESIKKEISVPDNSARERRLKTLIDEKEINQYWTEEEGWEHSSISDAVFSPDDKLILSTASGQGSRVYVVNVSTKKTMALQDQPTPSADLDKFVFSTDSRYVIRVSIFGHVSVYDVYTGVKINDYPAGLKPDPLHSEWMNPDGESFIHFDGHKIFLVDLKTGDNKKEFVVQHDQSIIRTRVRFSPNGEYLFAAYYDNQAKAFSAIWDVRTGRLINIIHHSVEIGDITFSHDSTLFLLSIYNKIGVWNTADASFVKEIEYSNGADMTSYRSSGVQMTADKKTIIASMQNVGWGNSSTGNILFFDFASGILAKELTPGRRGQGSQRIKTVRLNQEGNRIVTTKNGGFGSIWELNDPDFSGID